MPKPWDMKWAVMWPHTAGSWYMEEHDTEKEARDAWKVRRRVAPRARLVQMYVERP